MAVLEFTNTNANENSNDSGNWQNVVSGANAVPSDGDTAIFGKRATGPMTGNLDQATWGAKALTVIVEEGFEHYIGESGNPWVLGAYNSLIFKAKNTNAKSYFRGDDTDAGKDGDFDRIFVDARQGKEDLVNIDTAGTSPEVKDVFISSGSVTFAGATTFTGTIVTADDGVCTIPSACVLTNAEINVHGGTFSLSSSAPDIEIAGGLFNFKGSNVDIATILRMYGGEFRWIAFDPTNQSTIALAELYGGTFRTADDRGGRTLTTARMYRNAVMDLTRGGLALSLTNPVECYGANRPNFGTGAKYAKSV